MTCEHAAPVTDEARALPQKPAEAVYIRCPCCGVAGWSLHTDGGWWCPYCRVRMTWA